MSVWVDTREDRHPNEPVVFVDLDVVETIYDARKELDAERLIIGSDVDPVPRYRLWVPAREVWNRRPATGRVLQKGFLFAPGYPSHIRIVDTGIAPRLDA